MEAKYEVYRVAKGDWLSKISQKKYGDPNKYPVIIRVNNLKNDRIWPGQKLFLPNNIKAVVSTQLSDEKIIAKQKAKAKKPASAVNLIPMEKDGINYFVQKGPMDYKNPGGAPFVERWEYSPKILVGFKLTDEQKERLWDEFEAGNFHWDRRIKKGDVYPQMLYSNWVYAEDVHCNFSGDKDYPENGYPVRRVIIIDGEYEISLLEKFLCGNWFLDIRKISLPVAGIIPEGIPTQSAIAKEGPAGVPVAQAPPKKKVIGFLPENFDFIGGGGKYYSVNFPDGYSNNGSYWWAKARWRPISFNLGANKLNVGVFGFMARGNGLDSNSIDYRYKWNKNFGGLSAQYLGRGFDTDLDIGAGKIFDYGNFKFKEIVTDENGNASEIEHKFNRRQWEYAAYLSAHLNYYKRRAEGHKFFSKVEFNLETTVPFGERHLKEVFDGKENKLAKPTDHRAWELMSTWHIYDFQVGQFMITPGANIGIERDYNLSRMYGLLGPEATISWRGEDIIRVSPYNYKVRGGEATQRSHSGWIQLRAYKLYQAWQASRYTAASSEEVEAITK